MDNTHHILGPQLSSEQEATRLRLLSHWVTETELALEPQVRSQLEHASLSPFSGSHLLDKPILPKHWLQLLEQ